jgi:hypothetical protein
MFLWKSEVEMKVYIDSKPFNRRMCAYYDLKTHSARVQQTYIICSTSSYNYSEYLKNYLSYFGSSNVQMHNIMSHADHQMAMF